MEYDTIRVMRLIFAVFLFFSFNVHANEKLDDVLNYIPATHENISFSLWAMNAYDVSNEEAIDAYLKISKCPLFKKYRDDDFIWQNIREGEKRQIEYFADQYPNRFYVDSLLALGNYNFQTYRFELLENFRFTDAGTIRFPFFRMNKPFCGYSMDYADYFSRMMSFKSNTEYALLDIPVAPDKANELLAEIATYYYPRMDRYDRVVPIRFEITVTGYDFPDEHNIVLKGDMDRIQVFSDPERTNPIWTKQFKILN